MRDYSPACARSTRSLHARALASVDCGSVCVACERPIALRVRACREPALYGSLDPRRALIADAGPNPRSSSLRRALSLLLHVSQADFSLEKAMEEPQLAGAGRAPARAVALRTGSMLARSRSLIACSRRARSRRLAADPRGIARVATAGRRARAPSTPIGARLDPDRPPRRTAHPRRLARDRIATRRPDRDLGPARGARASRSSRPGTARPRPCSRGEFDVREDERAAGALKRLKKPRALSRDADVVQHAIAYYAAAASPSAGWRCCAPRSRRPTAKGYRATLAGRRAGRPPEEARVLGEAVDAEEPSRAIIAGFELASTTRRLGDYAKSLDAAIVR